MQLPYIYGGKVRSDHKMPFHMCLEWECLRYDQMLTPGQNLVMGLLSFNEQMLGIVAHVCSLRFGWLQQDFPVHEP